MASKKINLDEVINNAITINIGDECPFCKGENKFINDSENDIIEHIIKEHKPSFAKIIGRPISWGGIMNKTETKKRVILKREKDCVIINKEDKNVEFLSLSYTFDEVLQIAREIAETF